MRNGYDTAPHPKAILQTWPLRELHGMLFVYLDVTGAEPAWEIPDIDTEGWTPVLHHEIRMRGCFTDTGTWRCSVI